MGGRGTFASGKNVSYTYETIDKIAGVKILKGIGNMHGLPAESHSSNAYIQLHPDGTFKMYREFNEKHLLIKEIAYHPEPKLSGHRNPVLHIHEYRQGSFQNRTSRLLTRSEYEKYKKYFKGVSEK